MNKDKIDVIIPAYKAHGTIIRCLSSIACQTIIEDVSVTIVNDCCPEGDYSEAVRAFSPIMDVREIKMDKNGGPGLARQLGIDNTENEFLVFVDADDSLYKVTSLERLREEIQSDKSYMCISGSFASEKYKDDPEKFCHMRVWLFGKIYRRGFIDKYKIRFFGRANEDSGFNRTIYMLCDNPDEQIKDVPENFYMYNTREDSITEINGKLYFYDQGICGGIENIIRAIEHVRKYKPFSALIIRETVSCMTSYYFIYTDERQRVPDLSIVLWEYIKKFYHTCYKRIEDFVTDEAFASLFSLSMISAVRNYGYSGVIPCMTVQEFMHKLKTEDYDPNLIDEIRAEMATDPEYQEIMKNNIACGVCEEVESECSTDI